MFNVYVSPEEKGVRTRIKKRIQKKLSSYRPMEDLKKIEKEIDGIIER